VRRDFPLWSGAALCAALIAPATAGCRSDRAAAPAAPVPPAGMDSVSIAGHVLYMPAGFHISVFSTQTGWPRLLALGPDGAVYMTRYGSGQVVKIPDANHDGVGDTTLLVASGLFLPHGIAFRGDTMYVAHESGVLRYDPGAASPLALVTGLPAGVGHQTRTLAFGPDDLMYVSVGSSCNICTESDARRAAVVRYNLNGTLDRVFAHGLRNSVGLAFNPTTGELWATNNDRDDIGPNVAATDSLPPERINILKDGKNYGWPQCYLPGRNNPEFGAADCSTIQAPAITFTAHSAPLGIAFYSGTMFPAAYQGDALVALHGSWNRSLPTGAKLVRVRVQNGVPVSVEDFITGWQLPDGSRWGRPVGLLVLPDGSVLVSDDLGNRIWRITYGN
jgi:glucose/arabinose dehydrogenase